MSPMNMHCDKALALVEKLVDDEASPAEKREVEAHLGECASCREHFHFLTAVGTHYRAAELPEPPESYWEHLPRKIQKRIARESARERGGFFARILSPAVLRFGAIAATVVVVVAVGVNVLREDSLNPSQEAAPAVAPPAAKEEDRSEPEPPASPPARRDERFEEKHAAESAGLRSLGDVARNEDKPAEAAFLPSEPVAAAQSAEGLQSGVADVATEAEDRLEKSTAREQFSQLAVQNEPAAAAAPAAGRADVSRTRAVDDCERFRQLLSAGDVEGNRAADIRYDLARCSIRSLPPDATEERRAQARADAEAFLALESEGTRADEIRKALRTTGPR